MDRGAWQATVHSVAKSRTRLKQLSMHTSQWSGDEDSVLPHAMQRSQRQRSRSEQNPVERWVARGMHLGESRGLAEAQLSLLQL